jgi:hypothetical protein
VSPARWLRDLRVRTVLVALTVLVGFDLASRAPVRLDLTRDGRYGVSDAARASVRDLERPLVARVFFTGDLDAPYHEHRRALLDLLDELAVGSRLEVVAVDPGDDPAQVALAAGYGVHPVAYAARARGRAVARQVFLGVAFASGDRQVAIPTLPSIPRMEAEVVRAIREVTRDADERPSIAWWTGHGEPDPATQPERSPLHALSAELAERGTFRAVAGPIPEDVDLLVIAAPTRPVPAAELAALDAFRGRGGDVLLFVSSAGPDDAGLRVVDRPTGLATWLAGEGLALGSEVLLDRAHAEVLVVPHTAGGRTSWVRATHPLALVTSALDRGAPAVRPLSKVILPFASALAPIPGAPGADRAEVWATTEGSAVATLARPSLDPVAVADPAPDERPGPFPVIVATTRLDPPRRLVAVGSGDAIANNPDLVRNAIDWLVEDEDLLALRGRGDADPPLTPPSAAATRAAKAAMVGFPLALVALLAVFGRRLP